MSQNYSPSLINNGLVFCVDAADNKSAPHNQLPVKLGCVTWLDGADDDVFTFSSGTSVYEWRDKSGYNNNVYQSTTDNQPSRSTTYNSKSVVVFDCSNDSLSSTNSLDLSQGSTMFVMVRGYTSTSDAGVISINNVLSHGITIHNGNTTYFYYGSGGYHTTQSTGGTSETNLFVKVWTGETSGNRISYKNGTKGFSTGTMSSSNSTGVLRLGQQSTYLNGLIGEVIIYNRELTQAEITKVNNYLQNKWNITVSDAKWYDRTANENNGTPTNSPTYSETNKGYFGFDGVDDYVVVTNGMNSLVGTNATTFGAWIYIDTVTSSWDGVIANKVNVAEGIALLVSNTQKIFFQYDSTSGNYAINGGSNIPTAEWTYIVGTYDTVAGYKTYMNGELNDSEADAGKSIASSGDMSINIGAQRNSSGNPGAYFPGRIAKAEIYNKALSAAEVKQNYNNFKTRFGH